MQNKLLSIFPFSLKLIFFLPLFMYDIMYIYLFYVVCDFYSFGTFLSAASVFLCSNVLKIYSFICVYCSLKFYFYLFFLSFCSFCSFFQTFFIIRNFSIKFYIFSLLSFSLFFNTKKLNDFFSFTFSVYFEFWTFPSFSLWIAFFLHNHSKLLILYIFFIFFCFLYFFTSFSYSEIIPQGVSVWNKFLLFYISLFFTHKQTVWGSRSLHYGRWTRTERNFQCYCLYISQISQCFTKCNNNSWMFHVIFSFRSMFFFNF